MSLPASAGPGLYIVTLSNEAPISVNAHDRRRADRCIKVNRDHCKVGKTSDLSTRRAQYDKTFGAEVVTFMPLALLADIDVAERLVLAALGSWRIRGRRGRPNEWLAGIAPADVIARVYEALVAGGVEFVRLPVDQ